MKTTGFENKNQWFQNKKPNVNVNVNVNGNVNGNVNTLEDKKNRGMRKRNRKEKFSRFNKILLCTVNFYNQ